MEIEGEKLTHRYLFSVGTEELPFEALEVVGEWTLKAGKGLQ